MNCVKIDINICRVCLQTKTGTSIFSDDILEKLRFTTLVPIEQNDGMPELLCKECQARLRVAYNFKKQAQYSDEKFRTFITDVNQQFQQVTAADTKKEITDDELQIDAELLVYDEIGEACEIMNDHSLSNPIDVLDQTINVANDDNDDGHMPADEDTTDDNYGDRPEQMEVLILNENDVDVSGYTIENLEEEDDPPVYGQNEDSMNRELNDAEQLFEEEEHLDDTNYEPDAVEALQSTENKTRSKKTRTPMKRAGRKRTHYCGKCEKWFSTGTNLTRHMISHDGFKPYVCNICGNAFTQNGSLKSHMFIHTGERPYACTVCPKAFTQSKSLIFHMRRHTGEKPYQCGLCGMNFRQKDGLKRHENAKHTNKPATPYPCDVCGKILQTKYSLKFHMGKHTTKRESLKCDLCDKILYTEKALKAHKSRNHGGDVEFKCTTCDFQTPSKPALYTHQIMEHQIYPSEEIIFTCAECGEEFDNLASLEEHSKKVGHNCNQPENEFDFAS